MSLVSWLSRSAQYFRNASMPPAPYSLASSSDNDSHQLHGGFRWHEHPPSSLFAWHLGQQSPVKQSSQYGPFPQTLQYIESSARPALPVGSPHSQQSSIRCLLIAVPSESPPSAAAPDRTAQAAPRGSNPSACRLHRDPYRMFRRICRNETCRRSRQPD